MKSMGNIYHRQQAYLRTKSGQQMMKKEADNIIRRNFAMVFKVLHDDYGFGAKRLVELIQLLNDFAEEAAKDELWFDTVAAWFEGYTGAETCGKMIGWRENKHGKNHNL